MYGDHLPCAVCGSLPPSGDELRIERELALMALAAVADGVIHSDAEGRVRFCNEAALRLLGFSADAVLNLPLDQVVRLEPHDPGHDTRHDTGHGPLSRPLQGSGVESLLLQGRLRTAGGELLPVEGLLRPARGSAGMLLGSILVLRDLSQTQALAHQLLHQTSHDPLTGLPNRNRFEEQLTAMLAATRGGDEVHAMLHLDLDRFTVINDTCGHREADRLLQLVARELLARLRPDDILARIGDDKFGVILGGCGAEHALVKATALVEAIERARFSVGQHSFHLSLSAGVTGIERGVADARQLLIQADTACYVAKRLGGNRAQLYRSGDREVSRTRNDMEWVARIEQALDEDRLELHAQRIVPLDGGSAPCYELLVRLRLPDGSVAMPGAFLPAAQHFGLMDRIERGVVRQALDQLERLQRSADFGYLSINLSGSSLSDGGFTAFLLRELEQRATPPERVRFEITETAALGETAAAREFIAAMHRRGYKILLDDFGTGFTSFGYLKSLGANGLKVDQSFTRNLAGDAVNQAIVESICKIGSSLGLEIIAEGVEDEVTLQALRSLGVRHAQGWLFHRPEPLERVLQ